MSYCPVLKLFLGMDRGKGISLFKLLGKFTCPDHRHCVRNRDLFQLMDTYLVMDTEVSIPKY